MTEKKGGSDVANGTETLAIENGSNFSLYGYKWFTSAIDSDMSLMLARDVDNKGQTVAGTNGLSMYYVKIRKEDGITLNNIDVVRMKDKLGTR